MRTDVWKKSMRSLSYKNYEVFVKAMGELQFEITSSYLGKVKIINELMWLRSFENEPCRIQEGESSVPIQDFWYKESNKSIRDEIIDTIVQSIASEEDNASLIAHDVSQAFDAYLLNLKTHLQITKGDEIVRRYFVMNGFDGALTTLGIILGVYFVNQLDAKLIISAGIGAGFAMGVSGAWGAFMAERAERMRNKKDLEKALFTQLDNSVITRASNTAIVVVSIVDALSSVLTTVLCLIPFFLSLFGIIDIIMATWLAIIINLSTLFLLGLFLGKVSKSNILINGLLMVGAGGFTAMILYLISF